jgi:hypothetical protein
MDRLPSSPDSPSQIHLFHFYSYVYKEFPIFEYEGSVNGSANPIGSEIDGIGVGIVAGDSCDFDHGLLWWYAARRVYSDW